MSYYFEKSVQIIEGLRKSFQTADCKMANRPCYGYAADADGELVIQETEAVVVRWICARYFVGDSFGKIVTDLEKQGILSPIGKAKWNREVISKLLSNKKYTGSVLLQKTVSICGIQFQNDGEQNWVLIKGYHEAIIPVSDFEKAQQMKAGWSKAQSHECGMKMSF